MGCLKASIDSQIGYCSFLELVTLNLPQQLANEVAIYLLLKCFIVYAITIVPLFPPLPPSTQATATPTVNQSPPHCTCPWVTHLCSLTSLFPFLQPVPTFPPI